MNDWKIVWIVGNDQAHQQQDQRRGEEAEELEVASPARPWRVLSRKKKASAAAPPATAIAHW